VGPVGPVGPQQFVGTSRCETGSNLKLV
jgi:hypothetical protein